MFQISKFVTGTNINNCVYFGILLCVLYVSYGGIYQFPNSLPE